MTRQRRSRPLLMSSSLDKKQHDPGKLRAGSRYALIRSFVSGYFAARDDDVLGWFQPLLSS